MEKTIVIKIKELRTVGDDSLILISGEDERQVIAVQTLNLELPSLSLGDELEITVKKVEK